jgi:hypothetical protein
MLPRLKFSLATVLANIHLCNLIVDFVVILFMKFLFRCNFSDSGKIVAIADRYLTESDDGDTIPLDEMSRRNEKSDFVNEGFKK